MYGSFIIATYLALSYFTLPRRSLFHLALSYCFYMTLPCFSFSDITYLTYLTISYLSLLCLIYLKHFFDRGSDITSRDTRKSGDNCLRNLFVKLLSLWNYWLSVVNFSWIGYSWTSQWQSTLLLQMETRGHRIHCITLTPAKWICMLEHSTLSVKSFRIMTGGFIHQK